MPGRRFETDGIAGVRRGRPRLAQQAWQGRVDGGEERATGTVALVRYRVCSGVHPRGAG